MHMYRNFHFCYHVFALKPNNQVIVMVVNYSLGQCDYGLSRIKDI